MSDEYFVIESALNGLVLDLSGGATAMGTAVVTATRAFGPAADSQLWRVDNDGYLRNKKSGLVLSVLVGQSTLLSKLVIWPANDPPGYYPSPNQRWTHTADGHLVSGVLDGRAQLVADILYGTRAPGAAVGVFTQNTPTTSNQVWERVPESELDEGSFFIESALNGLVLDLYGGATVRGTGVVTAPRAAGPAMDSQRWQATTDGYLRNKKSGLMLSVLVGPSKPGSKLVIWPADIPPGQPATANQHWTYTQTQRLESGVTDGGPPLVAGILDGVRAPGAAAGVVTIPANAPQPSDQTWQLVPQAAGFQDEYTIESALSGLVLDLRGGSLAENTEVVSAPRATGPTADTQLWRFTQNHYVYHPASGLVLTVLDRPGTPPKLVVARPTSQDAPPQHQAWFPSRDGYLASSVPAGGTWLVADVPGDDPRVGVTVGAEALIAPPPARQRWNLVRRVPEVPRFTGQAVRLDGFNGFIEAGPAPTFGVDDFTIETWFRTGPQLRGGPLVAVGFGTSGQSLLFAVNPDGTLLLHMTSATADGLLLVATTVPTELLDGAWHHVAVVRRGVEAAFFVNGVPVDPSGSGTDVRPSRTIELGGQLPMALGGFPDRTIPHFDLAASRYLGGELDEVRLWSVARSGHDLSRGSHLLVDPGDATLTGRWAFDTGDFADSSRYARGGVSGGADGTAALVPSEIELTGAEEAYLVTQARLIQDWVEAAGAPRRIAGYRVVLSARSGSGVPLDTALTLSASAPVTLHRQGGAPIELTGDDTGTTLLTDALGELSFTIEASDSLACPLIKVRAGFMTVDERVVIAPDQQAHAALARLTGHDLLGQDASGARLPTVASGRRTAPLPPDTDPRTADALARAVSEVTSTAAVRDAQTDRPLTRSVDAPFDVLEVDPVVQRYQDPGLAPAGTNQVTDTIGGRYLPRDERVARVVVPEHAAAPYWALDATTFQPMEAKQVAEVLAGLSVTHQDAYASLLDIDAALFQGRRSISVDPATLNIAARRELARPWGSGGFLDELATAASILYTTVSANAGSVGTIETVVVTVVTKAKDAKTGLTKAFDAAIVTVEDAVGFVAAVLGRAGGKIKDLIDYVADVFDWDDILLTQDVLNAY